MRSETMPRKNGPQSHGPADHLLALMVLTVEVDVGFLWSNSSTKECEATTSLAPSICFEGINTIHPNRELAGFDLLSVALSAHA